MRLGDKRQAVSPLIYKNGYVSRAISHPDTLSTTQGISTHGDGVRHDRMDDSSWEGVGSKNGPGASISRNNISRVQFTFSPWIPCTRAKVARHELAPNSIEHLKKGDEIGNPAENCAFLFFPPLWGMSHRVVMCFRPQRTSDLKSSICVRLIIDTRALGHGQGKRLGGGERATDLDGLFYICA